MRIIVATIIALFLSASAEAATNFNQARLSWQWVPDSWTKYFRADCGSSSGQYDHFNRTAGLTTSLNISMILPRKNGIYYCIVRGANDSDPVDPLNDASNEVIFEIQGNWVYPQ